MNELTNVTTGEVRFSYAHLFKPYAAMPGQEEKYSVTILVPKTDTDTMSRSTQPLKRQSRGGLRTNGADSALRCLLFLFTMGTG